MNRDEIWFAVLVWITRFSRNALTSLIPPLIPILVVALEYPLWQLGFLVTLLSLGSGVGQAPMGYLSDTYDRRYILPTGLTIAGSSYLLFALAPHLGTFLPALPFEIVDGAFLIMCLSMFVCGLGTSVVHPTLYPMISENVQEKNKGKVMGIFGSAAKVGDGTTPILVGMLILALVWEEIILVVGLFGVVFGALLFMLLGNFETRPAKDVHTDENAEESEETVWTTDRREYVYPMFAIYLFFITRGFTTRGVKTFMPAFIVGVYGYSVEVVDITLAAESVANFYFSALLIVGAATQIVIGWIVSGRDARKVLIICMLIATIGILTLAFFPLSPLWLLLVSLVIGIGLWGLNPARDILISQITPAKREGRTFGYLWTVTHLTGAAIPTIIGYIADIMGLRWSFGVLAIASLLAIVSILLLYSKRVYVEPTRVEDQPPSVG